MTIITVKTQDELDAALKKYSEDDSVTIVINSSNGGWLYLSETGLVTVQVSGSAKVEAHGSSMVQAYGSATVEAFGSTTVEAYGAAKVWAYGTATVRAYSSATVQVSGSATVEASGLTTVWAFDSSTVVAYGSATVRAHNSATVKAYDTATVEVRDSVTVWAYDSATVRAHDTATVEASSHVAVHLHSARVTHFGGVIIDVTSLDPSDPQVWSDHTGAQIENGSVVLYKAVDDYLTAGHGYRPTAYPLGQDVTAPDWRDDHECGGGLHASPHPHQARFYAPHATRLLKVTVPLEDIRPIPGDVAKVKAQTLYVECEVTMTGDPITQGEMNLP